MASSLRGVRSVAAVTSATVAAFSFVVAPAAAEIESAAVYERTAYDGTIWEVAADGVRPLTWDEWSELGFPEYVDANTEYLRAAPFSTVYASTWFALAESEWIDIVTPAGYAAAGSPEPAVVPWVDGIEVHKWQGSSELFGTDPAGEVSKLNFGQWSAAGFPGYITRANRGFVSMTWDGTGAIAYMCDLAAGLGGSLTYEEWVRLGAPSPHRTGRVANDWVYSYPGPPPMSNMLHYYGPISVGYSSGKDFYRPLNYREWQIMGAPQPDSRLGWTPDMPDVRCASGSLSPVE